MNLRKLSMLVLLLVIVAALPAHAQEDTCWNKGGQWDAASGECHLRNVYEMAVRYPLELAQRHPAIESAIDDLIRMERQQFLQSAVEDLSFSQFFGPWVQDMDYELYAFNEHIVTVLFSIYEYTGGAHGNLYFQSITFDARDGSTLTLFDLFEEEFNPMPLLSSLTQERLLALMGDFADADWIAAGTGEDPANYRHFAITADELIFFFPPYQVAPYAAGPQEVRIPLNELDTILRAPFRR